MLSEADRSHIARYEAFLSLAGEMIGQGDVEAVARLLATRFKYICDVFSWRYLCPDAPSGINTPAGTNGSEPRYFAIECQRGQVRLSGTVELSTFEQTLWQGAKPRMLDSTALDECIADLPPQLRNPEIVQLQVLPLLGPPGEPPQALFFSSTRERAMEALDLKFVGLIAQFLHRKISHLRLERRMTEQLIGTLDHLRRTQDDLIQSEKLAALGSMVAGVSHELNTPIANARLMATSLLDQLRSFETLMSSQALKRSDLLRWQGGVLEMSQLLDRSLQRAATLLASFKQVAIDQTSERRRVFDLHDCVEDVLAALRPGIRKTPWQLSNDVPKGIECDTFPGPLGQILTNLVQNAALHAFEGRDQGQIVLAAVAHAGHLVLSVSDDGVGMDTATLVHIFEPFFTTKLGRGGSGLGLAISHRIATTILAGDLRAVSSAGTGSRFVLSMPQRTPRKL